MLQFNVQSSGLLFRQAAGAGLWLSEGRELCSQVLQAQPVAHDAAEVAEGGQSVVEGEAPGQPPVAGGSELPTGLAACRPRLLPRPRLLLLPLAALQELQLGHRVGGDPPEALRVQHGSGDADEEDDDLRGAKPAVSTSRCGGLNSTHPRPPWLAAIWLIAGSF